MKAFYPVITNVAFPAKLGLATHHVMFNPKDLFHVV